MSRSFGTALWAVGFLFFLQLYTLYVESIYRMSLIKLSMGVEMLGVLFMLAPLLVLFLGPTGERIIPLLAALGLLVARCAAPYLGAPQQIACAGCGVACFLVLIAYVLAVSAVSPRPDWRGAIGVAVILSILLRTTWWATLDWSMEAATFPLGAALFLLLLVTSISLGRQPGRVESTGNAMRSVAQPSVAAVGMFATLALIYLIVMSPGVVSAWSGTSYPAVVLLSVVAWAVALNLPIPKWPVLLVWNLGFLALLLGGILANRIAFPASPEAVVVVSGYDVWGQQLPLYAMLALSPVLANNLAIMLREGPAGGPRRTALAVLFGGFMMFGVTLLLIFTNVWGYVEPVSTPMRNQFAVPFGSAGIIMIITVALRARDTIAETAADAWARTVANVVGAVVLAWIAFVVVIALHDTVSGPDAPELRVMTYNMQQGSERDGDQRYIQQLRLIEAVRPDILLLQESDTPRPSGGNVDAPRLIADGLQYNLYFGPKTVAGTYGTAILSRFPLENVRTIFTYSDDDEVGTSVVEIVVGGRRIGIFDNHPAGSEPVKFAHVDALVAAAADYDLVIAGGDFNFREGSPYYAKVAAALDDTWLVLHPKGVGDKDSVLGGDASDAERFDMHHRIDHIFVSNSIKPVDAQYILTPDSMTDHPAYWCTMRLPANPETEGDDAQL